MEFLSLNESPAPRAPRVTRSEAIGLSLLLHALILLLFVQGDRVIPETLRRWLALQDSRPATPPSTMVPSPDAATEPALVQPRPQPRKMPVMFTYVRIPDDSGKERNPQGQLMSDRDRLARQELRTPADARRLSLDPHSIGDSVNRERPNPNITEGPDTDEPTGTDQVPKRDASSTAQTDSTEKGEGQGPGEPGAGTGTQAISEEEATIVRGEPTPPGVMSGAVIPPGSEDRTGRKGRSGGNQPGAGGGAGSSPTLRSGTESKFQFDNSGWLRDGPPGTLSFDTKGFHWGDYARKLQVAIRNRLIERLPLAYREGMAGFTCQYFIISRDGTIESVEIVRESTVPPYNRVVTDSIRAASRVPPLPDDFPNEREGVTGCFYFNMYPGEAE